MSFVREKLLQCYECDKKFHQQSQLVIHIRQHTGEKPFVCTFCSKGFASVKVLKVHERVHTGERPYKCPYCDKSFSAYANLVVHRRIHTNEKPYICKLCCRGFEHSGNLSRHFRAHMIDTGFRCILCGKVFELEHDILEHTKSDHPNEYETYVSSDKSRKDYSTYSESNNVELSDSNAFHVENVEENSSTNFNDISLPKERLITKINRKEMRIIRTNPSTDARNLPPKEEPSSAFQTTKQEESFPISIDSDNNISPLTDTSNVSDNSGKSWKNDLEEMERSNSQYEKHFFFSNDRTSTKKQLKLKKRKEQHASHMSENNYCLNYSSHSDDSPPCAEYNAELSHRLPSHFHSSKSPRIRTKNLESSFHNSCHSYEDSSNCMEHSPAMDHSSSCVNSSQEPLNYNENYSLSQSNSKNYFPAPPPLIPIEDIDQNSELPNLEPYHPSSPDHSENSLSSVMQDCDLYTDSVKSEFYDQYVSQQKPKLALKPETNYISNVKEIIQKSLKQFITPEIQKEVFKRKVERALCTIVGKNVMKHFGYPERTCEQVLICILDMENRNPCADVRINEIDRMKINMRKLIECSFPNVNSWDHLSTPKEYIPDNIQDEENATGSSSGDKYGASSSTLDLDNTGFAPIAFVDEGDSKQDIKSELISIFKQELK